MKCEHWLSWLARQMHERDQSVFYLEGMQPDWLLERWRQHAMTWGPAAVLGLVGGLVFGLPIGVIIGPLECLAAWLVGGLAFGVVAFSREIQPVEGMHWSWAGARRGITSSILRTVAFWPLVGLVVVVVADSWVFPRGIIVWLVGGLIGGLVGSLHLGRARPNEGIRRSSPSGLMFGLSFGLVFGLVAFMLVHVFFDRVGWEMPGLGSVDLGPIRMWTGWLVRAALVWLVGGLVFGLLGGLVRGLEPAPPSPRTRANEGIRRSARSALVGALVGGLVFGLVRGLGRWLPAWEGFWVVISLAGGLLFGLLFGLGYGGRAWLQHQILRLFLWRKGHTPLRYVRFLNYAAERIFLRKVGGGYIFIHRMLQDYFADQYEANELTSQKADGRDSEKIPRIRNG
jgi:hypothetical protein